MKRNCLILTVLVAGAVCLLQIGCQEQSEVAPKSQPDLTSPRSAISPAGAQVTEPEANEPEPKITFEKVVHDFGEVGPETKNICEFKFTNTGDGPLKITKVTKTCGCTPYTLEKTEYAPGESGILKVKYNSSKRPGLTTRRLFMSSNDKNNPKVALTIKAKIVLKVDYEPKRLNLLLGDENADCPEITIRSLDNQPFAIKGFKSTANSITIDYDGSVKAMKFVLQPKVNMEKLQKSMNGRIEISLTHPQVDTITIPFNALPEFKISPPALIVFNAEPQKPVTKQVWILNNYEEDFEVESVSSKKNIIRVLSQEKVGNRYKFELQIMPPAAEGKARIFTDVFFVNIKGGEKLEIACRGFYARKK
ncbi:MAG TPA: DUF1573 domain-containing protein [Phycisphaerales bacterium]|nr:DUF1573 domain-containing protein [Phycisphaerales bacterium]